jgi:hypothetical protein
VIVKIDAVSRGKAQAKFHAMVSDVYPSVYIDDKPRRVRFTDHEARVAIPPTWCGLVEDGTIHA